MVRRRLAYILCRCPRPSFVALLTGAVAAVCLATLCEQFVVLWGTSTSVSLALCAAVCLGWAAGCGRSSRTPRPLSAFADAGCRFTLAAWVLASPWLLGAIDRLSSLAAAFNPASPGRNSLVVFAVAMVFVGLPAFLTARLAAGAAPAGRASSIVSVLCGAIVGLSFWGLGAAQIGGPFVCAAVMALLGLAPSAWRLVRANATVADEAPPTATDPEAIFISTSFGGMVALGLECGLAAGFGGLLAALVRVLEQLLPGTIYLACAEGVGLLAGLACGLLAAPLATRWIGSPARARLWACLGLALFATGVLGAYPVLIQCALWLSAMVASPTLLILGRGALAALVIAPVGAAAGVCLKRTGGTGAGETRIWLVCGVLGLCLMLPAAERGISANVALIGAAWWLTVLGIARYRAYSPVTDLTGATGCLPTSASTSGRSAVHGTSNRHSRWQTSRQWRHAALDNTISVGALLIVLAAPVWRNRFIPEISARVLFSTGSFVAWRAGYGMELLPYLDEARLVGAVESPQGLTTVWKYGGNQLQLRQNGMPKGLVSCDPAVFPRLLSETLPAALPLVLHERPQSLLLLGLGSGEGLKTSLSFPVPEIVCWEADAGQIRVLREIVGPETGMKPFADDRVRFVTCDSALALDAEGHSFDVVVSTTDHPALLRSQACFAKEFYARAARRLAPAGIFCQRLQTVDLGPRPVATIIRTAQSVFHEVLAIETGPGDLLLAATNDPQGVIRPKLTERLEKPHVRALLAESGIDWSVVLNLSAYRHAELAKFCALVHRPNAAGNSRLPFSLPREVMRWGSKPQELHATLAPHAGRLARWIGADGESPVLVRRLAEVTGQQELMARYNDQYWAYRASLRTQLTEKPRSQIQQVTAVSERKQMHPEDRRRLQYFRVLGRATKSRSAEDIALLTYFETPYDPLMSYFVHLEAAELYARSDERNFTQELRHRLHATWFSSPRDASLRNVLATLALVCDHPEVLPEPVDQWDQINAALQALEQRWNARTGVQPRDVKATIDDIDATVLAAEKAFDTLASLAHEAGIPTGAWTARRSVLEKNLVRRVKAYRSELLPHLHRRKMFQEAASKAAAADEPAISGDAPPGEPPDDASPSVDPGSGEPDVQPAGG